jgi:hypothetical protein
MNASLCSHAGGRGYEEALVARHGSLIPAYLAMKTGNSIQAKEYNMCVIGYPSFTALVQEYGTTMGYRALEGGKACE